MAPREGAGLPYRLISPDMWLNMWRVWLIVIVAVTATGLSFGLGLQGRTLESVMREGQGLSLHLPGQSALPVVSLRHPDQAQGFLLQPSDLTSQTDGIESYPQLDGYYERQDRMMRILNGPSVMVGVKTADGAVFETEVKAGPLKISEFASSFWVSLAVGLIAFIVGGWVWCLKPQEKVTQVLVVNGLGMLIAAVSSCPAFAQPIALPSALINAAMIFNHFGTCIFGLTLVGLFLLFPRQVASDRQFWCLMGTGVPLFILDTLRWLGFPGAILIFCFVVIVSVTGLVIVQFILSRDSPAARASLLWLGLAVVVSGGSWGIVMMAYTLQGELRNMPESFTFLSFLILYIGIAVGVARFRLFDIGDWAFRIFFFTVAAGLFVALDAGLVYAIGLTRQSALALALLIVAFGYLPCRDLLWRRFVRTRSLSDNEMLASVLDMAFAPEAVQRRAKWENLLQRLFDPLSISLARAGGHDSRMVEDGLRLYVPELVDIPALELAYPQSGRGLFSPRHVELVNQIVRLSRKAALGLNAYERGAAEQRQRLAQDLHDDVGAKLVSGLAVADEASRPFIYSALNDIRDIAAALVTESVPLGRVLADMRHEAVRRLEVAQIDVEWPLWPEDAPFVQLSSLQKKALTSVVREIITNAIRHSRAGRMTVMFKMSGTALMGRLEDDGVGFSDTVTGGLWTGQGLKSVTDRIAQLNGRVRFDNLPAGAVTEFSFPLYAEAAPVARTMEDAMESVGS